MNGNGNDILDVATKFFKDIYCLMCELVKYHYDLYNCLNSYLIVYGSFVHPIAK